jgi:putative DNA primase/helicase
METRPGVPAPVVIVERGRDVHRGTETLTLLWSRDNKWQRRTAERRDIADQRAIIDLAAAGLPVNSINARTLIQYLTDYEAENITHLTVVAVSHKMGWQGGDGKDGFLWGRNLITAHRIAADDDQEEGQDRKRVRFRGADAGDDQLADGFYRSGSYDGWLSAIDHGERAAAKQPKEGHKATIAELVEQLAEARQGHRVRKAR